MPIYEYTCDACRTRFEFFARTLKERPEACPSCGGASLTKAFSTFAAKSELTSGCAHASTCAHAHGPGCGCCG